VLTEPEDLGRAELRAVLERHWGIRGVQLEYLPVGFGSHHWRAVDDRDVRWFVTADDLQAPFQAGANTDAAFAALDRAFRTAAWLRDEAELEFVVAPLRDEDGIVIRRPSDRYAVTVSPYVVGESSAWGPYETADDRRDIGRILGRLHAATEHVPTDLPRRDDFAIPARPSLVEALEDLDRPWAFGPFAEPVRHLLRGYAGDLAQRLHEQDELAAHVRESSGPWVVTHGEPHRANVIRDPQGGVHLVDWDTTLIAPRERDLRMVLDEDLTGWDDYLVAAGEATLNEDAIELYRRWWELADITTIVGVFRREHERTEDAAKSWKVLSENLSALRRVDASA
jgi:spectinomycin phosphotransferase